ncbi:MAG: TRAP transporter large permease subunit [Leptospiraceae bacterium]|nr:TRAP transporter large permease subunit [Leptospiraceae bacterium]MDW7975905.1 TRAP transporter large permease subunit [Leptospiraceae bacterium]
MMENIFGPLMFIGLLIFVFSGYPVAFALAGTGIFFSVIGILLGIFDFSFFNTLPERLFGIMSNYVLLAIPFFIFMGTVLEKSKLAENLLTTIGMLFGPLRGGLAIAVVFVGTLLAAATGVVGATVVAMGLISLPIMLRYNYSKELSAGVICASGTLGQVIPPSVVLVVLGDQLGVSVGDLFLGSVYPGLLLSGLYIIFIIIVALVRPDLVPALPKEVRNIPTVELIKKVIFVLLPPLFLILMVLGSIFAGIATPTEAGALGAVGAMILAALNKQLNLKNLKEAMDDTAKLTVMVVFLLIGSTVFALVFRGFNGDVWIDHLLTNLPGGKWGFLFFVNFVIFILGFFIDFFEIVFIVVPMVVSAAIKLDIDMVWFGVMIGMNLQTSFLTPPFGFSLFYLKGVAPPELKIQDIYRGVVPFIIIQLIGLIIMIVFPEIVNY